MTAKSGPPAVTKPRAPADHADGLVVVASYAAGVVRAVLPFGGRVTLGRAPSCDLIIDDESVSREHAVIEAGSDGALTIVDRGSRNGTAVAGKPIAPGERVAIATGVPLAVGSATVYVLAGAPQIADVSGGPRPDARGPVVADPAMQRLYALLDVIGPTPLPVLVLGETGVGKEVLAEVLHARSQRAQKPLLKLNCAALPESMLEAELFGYDKGAFTGAVHAKPGLFEAADGGTVLLDEIGDLPLTTQVKLLRVLETGDVMRLGSVKPVAVDVRFVSATHVDLKAKIDRGQFRADLYFRLDGITVVVPPLRERTADVVPLARMFAARVAERIGRAPPALSGAAIAALERHTWPGNVRELRHVIDRAVVLCAGAAEIGVDQLRLEAAPATAAPPTGLQADLDRVERDKILHALEQAGGNQTRAAKLLGISRHALLDRLDRHGLPRPRKSKL